MAANAAADVVTPGEPLAEIKVSSTSAVQHD
jgi:hypothetical protein